MNGADGFDISRTDDGLRLSGELDAHTAPLLQAALADVDDERTVLDMAGVAFVDSSGLRVLIQAHQAAGEAGRTLVLTNPSDAVTRLLEISGVAGYLVVD